jgi:hypothetical protein
MTSGGEWIRPVGRARYDGAANVIGIEEGVTITRQEGDAVILLVEEASQE